MATTENPVQIGISAEPLPESRRDRARSGRMRILWSVLALEFALLTLLIRRDAFLALRIGSFLHPAAPASRVANDPFFKNDPHLGAAFPQTGPGAHVRKAALATHVGYLVVPIGDCAGCIKANLPAMQLESAKRGISMVVVTSSGPEAARGLRRRFGLHVPIVIDREQVLEHQLNLAWYGRPYLYTTAWRLSWLPIHLADGNPFTDPDLLRAVAGGAK